MPKTNIIVIRHGETEWNIAGRLQGWKNSPLTERGKSQARAVASALSEEVIDVCYSSDLGRAMETAEIVAEACQLDIRQELRLRERNLGVLEGLTKAEILQAFPEAQRLYMDDPDYAPDVGEKARDRYERCVSCIEEIAGRHLGQTVLVVTHGGIVNSIMRRTMQLPISLQRCFSLYNAAINRIHLKDGTWYLDSWGDTAHLGNIKTFDDTRI